MAAVTADAAAVPATITLFQVGGRLVQGLVRLGSESCGLELISCGHFWDELFHLRKHASFPFKEIKICVVEVFEWTVI